MTRAGALAEELLVTVTTAAGCNPDAATGGKEACRIKRVEENVRYDHRADRVTGSRRRVDHATPGRLKREG